MSPADTVAADAWTLEETNSLSTDVRALLLNTLWGTPGHGALYRIRNLDFFNAFPALHFHNLRDDAGRLVATRYFHDHVLAAGPHRLPSIYHSFSCVQPEQQGRGYGGLLAARSRETLRARLGGAGGMIYAYVEKDNLRNINNLQKAGYRIAGEFVTAVIGALKPAAAPQVRQATPADVPAIRALYRAFYAESAFRDDSESFTDPSYYVHEEGGRITAAVHAKGLHWSIEKLGFPGDTLALWALARLPGLRMAFNASDLRFVKFGNPCYAPNHAKTLAALIDGVLALMNRHTALIYLDPTTSLTGDLKRMGTVGWLNLLGETPVRILSLFDNVPAEVQEAFVGRAKTFSPFNL